MKNDTAKAGKLLMLDYGQYSDYGVLGFFVVLKDFKPMDELERYLSANEEQRKDYNFDYDGYVAHLLAQGLLLEIEHGTLYLGSYSSADISFRASQTVGEGL